MNENIQWTNITEENKFFKKLISYLAFTVSFWTQFKQKQNLPIVSLKKNLTIKTKVKVILKKPLKTRDVKTSFVKI